VNSFKLYLLELNEEMILIESFLDEMANLNPNDTGFPYVIWIGTIGGQHGPRIKISNTKGRMNSTDCFVVDISKNPTVLTKKSCKLTTNQLDNLFDWIKLNYSVLMELYKAYETGTGSILELQAQLKKI